MEKLTSLEKVALCGVLNSLLADKDTLIWVKEMDAYSAGDRVIISMSREEYLALKRVMEKL